jgi:hypothetical protein
MKNTKSLFIGFAWGVVTCLIVEIGVWFLFPSPQNALRFCTSFKEERYEDGFLPDFSYKLEAKITADQFKRFVRLTGFPESSRRNPFLYIIDKPEREYGKKAEYLGGTLYYEEFKY